MSSPKDDNGHDSDHAPSSSLDEKRSGISGSGQVAAAVEAAADTSQPELIKVPRSERRGLGGRFTVVAEVTDPKEYPRSIKYLITVIIAFAGTAAPLGSTIIFRTR